MKKEDGYSHILKYTSIFGGVQGVNILVSIIRNKLVALLLGPEGMGLVSLFNSTIKLVSDSTNFGLSMSSVRNISSAFECGNEDRLISEIQLVRTWSLFTAIFGMLVCILMSPLLNSWTFNCGDHTLHFVLLSPIIALVSLSGGELAILKGIRRLKILAIISIYNVILNLIISIPIFYIWRDKAIIPTMFLVALIQMLVTIFYSSRVYPYRIRLRAHFMIRGYNMMKLGMSFLVAGLMGSGCDFIIRSYINKVGSLSEVGLFNAGYMMTMVYAGMIFAAMETDYFPRLSAIKSIGSEMSKLVNHQINASVLLLSPLLVLYSVCLPVILPLFLSRKFLPALELSQIMILAMYLRAAKLPLAYIPLAKGNSKSYMLMESIDGIMMIVFVLLMYFLFGLKGAGYGMVIAAFLDYLTLNVYMKLRYRYTLDKRSFLFFFVQSLLGVLTYLIVSYLDSFWYWISGSILFVLSVGISCFFFQKYTEIFSQIISSIKNKLHG